jgi:MFS family permease
MTSFVSNLFATIFVDRIPRNVLIVTGLLLCMTFVILTTALSANFIQTDNKPALRATIAMLYLYIVSYAITIEGPNFYYTAEIFPSHLRAKGMTLAMASLCVGDIIWLVSAPTAFKNIGWKFYICFIVVTAIGATWIAFTFPDTRKKPLEEIAKMFGDEDLVMVYQKDIYVDATKDEIVVQHDENRDMAAVI